MLRRFLSSFFTFGYLLCFFTSIPSDARPGGGQSYSSGGGGGSSGGGSSSGSSGSYGGSHSYSSGGSVGDIDGLTFVIGAVVVIIILISSAISKKNTPQRKNVSWNRALKSRGLSLLREHDPSFSDKDIEERTKRTMSVVNQAWIAGSMDSARRLISDGVYIRFQTQLQLLATQGLRNFMSGWKVVSAEFIAAESDTLWDTVHIKVVGEARDVDVPVNSTVQQAETLARRSPIQQYQEVWSFVRKRGAVSKSGAPVLEGRCPNCGADLAVSESVQCTHCRAIVNSGEYDFVLSEITQPEEWAPLSSQNSVIPGLSIVQQRDPNLSRQELEDRASVVFWKWIEAITTGNAKKLLRFCANDPSLEDIQRSLGTMQTQLSSVAVGSSDVRRVMINEETHQDQAWVEIRWSASIRGSAPQHMRHYFLLGRQSNVVSKRGLSCLDCPVCGGPLASSDAVTCSYCGETISGDKYEWALLEVLQRPPA